MTSVYFYPTVGVVTASTIPLKPLSPDRVRRAITSAFREQRTIEFTVATVRDQTIVSQGARRFAEAEQSPVVLHYGEGLMRASFQIPQLVGGDAWTHHGSTPGRHAKNPVMRVMDEPGANVDFDIVIPSY